MAQPVNRLAPMAKHPGESTAILRPAMSPLQNAIDRIVWALYARPRANPSYVEVLTVGDALKASGALSRPGSIGHYLLERHVPRHAMRFSDGLLGFACSLEEIYARFRASVLAATVPQELRGALCR